jgi:hypothetical protein
MPSPAVDFVVGRTDMRRTAFVPARTTEDVALTPGQILVRVDKFAFTANNVTYGTVGDMIGYWGFFPADEGWGRLPVWGFGDVVRSTQADVAAGERVYGYLPISTYVVLQPERVALGGFVDASAHRAALPPIYNQYARVAGDASFARASEDHVALFRPLFTTSFLLDDFHAEQDFFGARSVVLSSASSKTALGLAFLLREGRQERVEVVGLTSSANRAFVEATGYYARVVAYDDLRTLPSATPTVFVDFAGNGAVLAAVHRHFDAQLRYSCRVGLTHWERMAAAESLPGPEPVFFFAPDHARKHIEAGGAGPFRARVDDAMQRFSASASRWLRVVHGRGPDAIESLYREMLDGRADPATGHILSL